MNKNSNFNLSSTYWSFNHRSNWYKLLTNLNEVWLSLKFKALRVKPVMRTERGMEQLIKTISSGVVPVEFETNCSCNFLYSGSILILLVELGCHIIETYLLWHSYQNPIKILITKISPNSQQIQLIECSIDI